MIRDLHVHTTYCDGKSSPREIVESAIEKKVDVLGFSGHSYVDFDNCCMTNSDAYITEINSLKEEYKGRIEILCGIEKDYFSDEPTDRFDYVIGSVHYFCLGGEYISVDLDAKTLINAAKRFYDGDIYALCEEYYRLVADVADKLKPDIIGHFDLITKFNEGGRLFDENHPRYISAWKMAADRLLSHNIPFEINSGAISRGYRTMPYPSPVILDYIKKNGGSVIINSDSHKADTLCFKFDLCKQIAEGAGFRNF